MIIIYEPEWIKDGETGTLRALFEIDGHQDYLWFAVPAAYQEYVTYERGDAFLVGLLLLAMKKGQDIKLQFPVSARLYYTLTHYLINALHIAMPSLKPISILAQDLESSPITNSGAVGTGFSGGVDSFHTVYEHLHGNCPEPFKLTHFVFHNIGSHGDFGGEDARKLFKERLQAVKPFADEMKIDTIPIDSNLSEVLHMNFAQTHTIRNAAAILTLQKLFRYYYYSSGRQLKHFALSPISGSYDILSLPMLSTESLTFFSAGSGYSRMEKTAEISGYVPTYRYLNVCTNDSSMNCSVCVKCLRTMLTLEVLGKLPLYKHVFDRRKYQTKRTKYIAQVVAMRNKDTYSNEIYRKMKENQFPIPALSILLSALYRLKFTGEKIAQQVWSRNSI
ncbi:hypothetical protein KFZ56_16615 [Virgibacillus sp. NKC19-3]|uniref:hypothetical protein n=1 Tax=Virgibacillus saliphilus TaxID=2831674 RepID=UPI001C9AA18E|nr:hypothetical protein [Virgibacillus sp. NKC19-3]MBY7144645.1 hypothetical protein [Virgibacillus sp. NKC19-3]